MKRKYVNVANVQPSKGRKMGGPILVVPDDAMTPKEIQLRFMQGKSVPVFNPSYSDEDLPDLKSMDLTEIQELQDDLNDRIKAATEELSKRQNDDPNDESERDALNKVQPD